MNHEHAELANTHGVRMVRGLDWYSISVGLGEALMPGLIGRLTRLRRGVADLVELGRAFARPVKPRLERGP